MFLQNRYLTRILTFLLLIREARLTTTYQNLRLFSDSVSALWMLCALFVNLF